MKRGYIKIEKIIIEEGTTETVYGIIIIQVNNGTINMLYLPHIAVQQKRGYTKK